MNQQQQQQQQQRQWHHPIRTAAAAMGEWRVGLKYILLTKFSSLILLLFKNTNYRAI